jgi:hypothetical protein
MRRLLDLRVEGWGLPPALTTNPFRAFRLIPLFRRAVVTLRRTIEEMNHGRTKSPQLSDAGAGGGGGGSAERGPGPLGFWSSHAEAAHSRRYARPVDHAIVHAADIQDRDGGVLLMATLFSVYPFLLKLYVDGGYQGAAFQGALRTILKRVNVELVKRSDLARCFVERASAC